MSEHTLVLVYNANDPLFPSKQIRLSDDIVISFNMALQDVIKRGFATVESLTYDSTNKQECIP